MKSKIAIAAFALLAAIYFFSSPDEVRTAKTDVIVGPKDSPVPEVEDNKSSLTENLPDESKSTETDDSTDPLDSLTDPTEISIFVLEKMKSSELNSDEKMEVLRKSLSRSSKMEAQNLLETVIFSNSDPEVLAEGFYQLARISSQKEMRELFDRLEIMSSYTPEKERAIKTARSRYLK